ncbi:MAG: type II secretion system protein GspN [Deltaproteobacteria bacterium]|nr:MAG: type II secretion system protein GspN [Deltaproteobacteria bacterium]
MLTRILIALGGLVWSALVFVVVLWWTFPSQAIVDRLAYEVQESSGGDYALTASAARPWWAGLSLYDVEILAIDGDEVTPLFDARSVSARSSLFSAFSSRIPVYAKIDLGDARIDIEAGLDRSGSNVRLADIKTEDAKLSLGAIGAFTSGLGADMSGTGDLSLDVDLTIGEDSRDHEGRVAIRGRKLGLNLAIPDPFGGDTPFQLDPISVSSLDLVLETRNGKITLRTAELRSDLAHLDLEGDLTLDPFFNRSRLRGKAVLSQLGGQLATFEGFLRSAKWADGTYHYTIACTLDRLGTACFREDRERGSARPAAPSIRAPAATPEGPRAITKPGASRVDPARETQNVRAEREKARQERLSDRRARLQDLRSGRSMPIRPSAPRLEELDELDDEALEELGEIGPSGLGTERLLDPALDELDEFEDEDWE